MLRKLTDEVRNCYERADECGRKANASASAELRADFLLLQQSWLNLARSYEFAERLLDFSAENNRRRAARLGGDKSKH